jgi:uncharacterized protein HemX
MSNFGNEVRLKLSAGPISPGVSMFAFLFSKIGLYLVGAALIIALAGGGYLYVMHLQTVAADAKAKAAAAELKAKIAQEAQTATAKVQQAQVKVRIKYVKQKREIERVVETNDLSGVDALYGRYGVRIPPATTSPGGPGGNSSD